MIARTWKGSVPYSKRDAYIRYIEETGLTNYKKVSGNLGVFLFLRDYDEKTEFTTMTLWDSVSSIKQFAGEDYQRAVYYPEDDEFLLDRSEFVDHAEVAYAKSDAVNISL